MAVGAGIIALSAAMTRYPRFMDYDKDQARLIDDAQDKGKR